LGGEDRGGFVRGILRGGFKEVGDMDFLLFIFMVDFTLPVGSTTPLCLVDVEGGTDGSGTAARFSSTL